MCITPHTPAAPGSNHLCPPLCKQQGRLESGECAVASPAGAPHQQCEHACCLPPGLPGQQWDVVLGPPCAWCAVLVQAETVVEHVPHPGHTSEHSILQARQGNSGHQHDSGQPPSQGHEHFSSRRSRSDVDEPCTSSHSMHASCMLCELVQAYIAACKHAEKKHMTPTDSGVAGVAQCAPPLAHLQHFSQLLFCCSLQLAVQGPRLLVTQLHTSQSSPQVRRSTRQSLPAAQGRSRMCHDSAHGSVTVQAAHGQCTGPQLPQDMHTQVESLHLNLKARSYTPLQ